MNRNKPYILSFFLIFIFIAPFFIQGLHDTFEHDYSHDFHKENEHTSIDHNHSICVIHSFKYSSFDYYNTKPLQYHFPVQSYIYQTYTLNLLENDSHNFYLLRAPPQFV